MSWIFYDARRLSKKEEDLEGLDAFGRSGRVLLRYLAADIAGVGFKKEPTTPHQIDGVRLSKSKGAHKSYAPIIDTHPLG